MSSNEISIPIYKSAVGVSATDMACLVARRDQLQMRGFGSGAHLLSPWQQVITMVEPTVTDSELVMAIRNEGERRHQFMVGCVAAMVVALIFAVLAVFYADSRDIPLAPVEWSVSSIQERGLIVASGTTRFDIPVGTPLPNGDVLLSTSPSTNAYTTKAGTTRLGQNK